MNTLKNFPYSSALVLGLAKSGTAAANVLLRNGINVRVNDVKATDTEQEVINLQRQGAEVILGSHPLSVLDKIDVVIKNPGISYDHIIVKEALKQQIPVLTEVELAQYLVDKQPIIGVTGSNGKTTTTTLIYEMMRESNVPVQLAGNIGIVACEVAEQLGEDESLLVELSSFQLLGVETFSPHISVLLNVYEAHLDYHGTIEEYVQAKANIFARQTEDDFLIYNADNEFVQDVVKQSNATLIPFSTTNKETNGAWVEEGSVYFQGEEIISLEDVVLVGEHNVENILAAICVTKLMGTSIEAIKTVLQQFSGVKHRLQFVKDVQGRLFYNDSKATNILATQKALQSFTKPVILLAGGLDRGTSFAELLPFMSHVKAMVVFGETAKKLVSFAKQANIKEIKRVANVKEAASAAFEMSEEGDVILLSPACASWDQYKTFEERGDMFVDAVHKLA